MTNPSPLCREHDCERPVWARGLCSRHYLRQRAAGTLPPAHAPYAARFADDVDPVVVDRLVAGMRPESFTSFERREAVRRLIEAGAPVHLVCARIGINDTQVRRDIARTQVAA